MTTMKDRIRTARKAAGYTSQDSFAVACGVSKRTAERWENGIGPSLRQIPAIARVTGKPASFFLGTPEEEEAAQASVLDRLIAELTEYRSGKLAVEGVA